MKGQLLMLLRQYRILLKRTSKKFINLLLLLIIPFTAFYVKNLPMEEKSTVFICGYYMEESNSYLAQVEQELSGHQDCFTFEKCSSKEELKDQVASGRYDCGFAFDNGFSDAFIHDIKNCHIRLYTSPSSMFQSIFSETLFDRLLDAFSPAIAVNYLASNSATKDFYRSSFQSYLEDQYRNYMNSDSVFRLSVNNTGAYHGTTDSVDLFPVHAFTGFLLFLSSLVGLLVYLKDQDDRIYDRVSKRKRLRFCLTGILANITPVWLVSVVTLYLYEQPEAILPFLLKMSGYVLLCLLFAFICLLIFRHYKPFVSALPVLVICTLIFSPIFLHLEDYAPILRYLSYLFPPTFF